jgi:hypothetical protein
MATRKSDLERLFEQIISERDYFDRLMDDPAAALRELGIRATRERVAAIRKLDERALRRMADLFGLGIKIPC